MNKRVLLSAVSILVAVSILAVGISKNIELKQNLTGYLKRASNASTIELAKNELSIAIKYLEDNSPTEGYTSIFWKTPDDDIGFWYKNLKESYFELENLNSESSSTLEKTNVLMKLRETLLDGSENSKVNVPKGLSVYPDNKLWAALTLIAVVLGFSGLGILVSDAEKRSKMKKDKQPLT